MADVTSYRGEFFTAVKALWEEVFPHDPPWNRAEIVIPAKMAMQPELFLVALKRGSAVGAALAGYDGHRGWLYSVAVNPLCQRQGVGSQLVREAEARLKGLGCRKINLQIRSTNLPLMRFYHHLGYAKEERIDMGKRL